MKSYWWSYLITLSLLVLLSILLLIVVPMHETSATIVSPLPDFLTRVHNKQVSTLSLFFPGLQSAYGSEKTPIVTAKAALMYDVVRQKALFTKEPELRLPMASLTKIMTAIVALEHSQPTDTFIVEKRDMVGEDSMGVGPGEILTLEELLYGLILPSGNDASEVIANNYPEGREAFIQAMNDKAQALGLSNTHFTNPSGLQGDGDQYTTASDLLVITKYALSFPLFRKIAATAEYTIPYTANHKAFYLSNETNLLTTYPGVKGVKTGYTPEAGLCLVTYFDDGKNQLIGVVLNSASRRDDMREMLDYSLGLYGVKVKGKG